MKPSPKLKVSVSLPADLVGRIDSASKARRQTRSAVMEQWLRQGERVRSEEALARELEAYYQAATPEERSEDQAIARASASSAKRLKLDEEPPRRQANRRKRGAKR